MCFVNLRHYQLSHIFGLILIKLIKLRSTLLFFFHNKIFISMIFFVTLIRKWCKCIFGFYLFGPGVYLAILNTDFALHLLSFLLFSSPAVAFHPLRRWNWYFMSPHIWRNMHFWFLSYGPLKKHKKKIMGT